MPEFVICLLKAVIPDTTTLRAHDFGPGHFLLVPERFKSHIIGMDWRNWLKKRTVWRIAAFIPILTLTCCSDGDLIKALPQCWNVNELTPGTYSGSGVFFTSIHGRSLQAPGCSDVKGSNNFAVDPAEHTALVSARLNQPYWQFDFVGVVELWHFSRRLRIKHISRLKATRAPNWVDEMYLRSLRRKKDYRLGLEAWDSSTSFFAAGAR